MNKLDDGAANRSRRTGFANSDDLARRQRRIIFAAFGRREGADGRVVDLPGRSRPGGVGPSVSVRPGDNRYNVVGFPIPAAQRRKA